MSKVSTYYVLLYCITFRKSMTPLSKLNMGAISKTDVSCESLDTKRTEKWGLG